jgi:hypothetical protein
MDRQSGKIFIVKKREVCTSKFEPKITRGQSGMLEYAAILPENGAFEDVDDVNFSIGAIVKDYLRKNPR